MTLAAILKLLPKVGPIVAAAPEFKELVEEIISTLSSPREQAVLQEAYERAIEDAESAHVRLQQLVTENT